MDYQGEPTFARLLTVRVRWVLSVLVVAYAAQAFTEPRSALAALAPIGAGFRPWQPLSYSLYQGPIASAFMGWLVVLFLLESTWRSLGTRRLALAGAATWGASTLAILGLGAFWRGNGAGLVYGPFWLAEAMVVWVAAVNRHSYFRLFIGSPIPALWVAYGFGAISLVRALLVQDLSSVHQVFAWGAAWSILLFDEDTWRRWRLQRRKKQLEKEHARFTVLEGGKSGERPRRSRDDDRVN